MLPRQNVLVTGGVGFIGSALVEVLLKSTRHNVMNLDKLTYASVKNSYLTESNLSNYKFIKGDIADKVLIDSILNEFKPNLIFNLAAETHVDNSIIDPQDFLHTNVIGTFNLLECLKRFVDEHKEHKYKLIHISTDEVFGSLGVDGYFREDSQYSPSSPYSASKASSDHLVTAWHRTFGLKTIITNCSNNFGPRQNKEKLIPKTITNALNFKPIEIYGSGKHVRDWLYVYDHIDALIKLSDTSFYGETFNIGGNNEKGNLTIVREICKKLDELLPPVGRKMNSQGIRSYAELITHVQDRPGHDFRYAIDPSKLMEMTDWQPRHTFEFALESTVDWYLNHEGI